MAWQLNKKAEFNMSSKGTQTAIVSTLKENTDHGNDISYAKVHE